MQFGRCQLVVHMQPQYVNQPLQHLVEEWCTELESVLKIKRKIIKIAKLLLVAALDGVITGGDCGWHKKLILGSHACKNQWTTATLLEESFMELHALAKIKIKIIKIAKLLLVAALDGVITGGDCGWHKKLILGSHACKNQRTTATFC